MVFKTVALTVTIALTVTVALTLKQTIPLHLTLIAGAWCSWPRRRRLCGCQGGAPAHPYIPASLCVRMSRRGPSPSLYPYIPICADFKEGPQPIPISLHPYMCGFQGGAETLPTSHPYILIPISIPISLSLYPYIPISLYPYIPISLYPYPYTRH